MQRVGEEQASNDGGLGGTFGWGPELVARLCAELSGASVERTVSRALELGGDDLMISFSGAEDVLLLEYAHRSGRAFRVLTLDTGRLHPETYRFLEQVEQHYGLRLEVAYPATAAIESLVRDKGLFSFYRDGHQECCGIRKVEPLARQLAGVRSWMTGQRRDQSPNTRDAVEIVELDRRFVGRDGAPLLKWNPLARTSSADVWDAIRAFEVPFNPLHARGFVSIGCEPCTRATLPGQHEREGRWWWEQQDKKECGLHLPGTANEPAE
ncbi:MAG: phosphoadenylyl-sulfate reductase [Deltaproteobacteria bacterium]|nr:phosphoadenylyl-sulfate reductase [Nannocystaceae bacterium]